MTVPELRRFVRAVEAHIISNPESELRERCTELLIDGRNRLAARELLVADIEEDL